MAANEKTQSAERLFGDFEKASLNMSTPVNRATRRSRLLRTSLTACVIGAICYVWTTAPILHYNNSYSFLPSTGISDALCPQADLIFPQVHKQLANSVDSILNDSKTKSWVIENLAGSVRVPTEGYDDMLPPGEDKRWETFGLFHEYLAQRFPLVHSKMQVTKVNTYALLFSLQGSEDLKPILLMGHMDTVPVLTDTADQWIHPPFSGLFDGQWLWGRGSCDDKSGVIGTLTAMELLLGQGFQPSRTIVLAYGIDEESSGDYGAGALSRYILDIYGEDSFAMLVDEGGRTEDRGNLIIASPSTAEKGLIDVQINVNTPGGHSSVPPPHTGIGHLSKLISALEANPFPSVLKRDGTYFSRLSCAAEFDDSVSPERRELIRLAAKDDLMLDILHLKMLEENPNVHAAMTGTSLAVDLIGGGVKVNALPERVWAVVDHRIADWSSVQDVKEHYMTVLPPVAAALNLSLSAFGDDLIVSSNATQGHIAVDSIYADPLEPASVTPTFGHAPWKVLAGTIRGALATALRSDYGGGKNSIVTPGMPTGNTDTRFYWRLTKHIFRYSHIEASDTFNGAHTINEAIRAEAFVEMVRFYTMLVLNVDEAIEI